MTGPGEYGELVKRLHGRALAFAKLGGNYGYYAGHDALLDGDVATAIESLVRERDALIASTGDHITVRGEYLTRAETAEAALAKAREALLDTLASLVAAVSLLERSPKTAAPSNRMFDQMLTDYRASIKRARTALTENPNG